MSEPAPLADRVSGGAHYPQKRDAIIEGDPEKRSKLVKAGASRAEDELRGGSFVLKLAVNAAMLSGTQNPSRERETR